MLKKLTIKNDKQLRKYSTLKTKLIIFTNYNKNVNLIEKISCCNKKFVCSVQRKCKWVWFLEYNIKKKCIMKATWTFTLSFLFTTLMMAQYQNGTDYLPVKVGDKYGYIDQKGEIVIEPQFNWADRFSEGLALVRMEDDNLGYNGKYGYINPEGKIVIEPAYINQRVAHLKIKGNLSSEYLTLVINSILGQTQLLREMTIAPTVGHLNNVAIMETLIPIIDIKIHDEITQNIKTSILLKTQSKQLLKIAKIGVEKAIETNETEAMAWMEKRLGAIEGLRL